MVIKDRLQGLLPLAGRLLRELGIYPRLLRLPFSWLLQHVARRGDICRNRIERAKREKESKMRIYSEFADIPRQNDNEAN